MKSLSFKMLFLLFLVVLIFVLFENFSFISYRLSFLTLGPVFFFDSIVIIGGTMIRGFAFPLLFVVPFFVMALVSYKYFLGCSVNRVFIILSGIATWAVSVLLPFIYFVNTCHSEQCLGIVVLFPLMAISLVVLLAIGIFLHVSAKNPESKFFKSFVKIINWAIILSSVTLAIFILGLFANSLFNKSDTDWGVGHMALTDGPDFCAYHSNPEECLVDSALAVIQTDYYQQKDPFVFCDAFTDVKKQADCYYLIVQDQARKEYSLLSYAITDDLYNQAYGSCIGSDDDFDLCFREWAIKILGDVDFKSEVKAFIDLESEFKIKSLSVCERFNDEIEDQKACSNKLLGDYLKWATDWDKQFESEARAYHIQDTIDTVINKKK